MRLNCRNALPAIRTMAMFGAVFVVAFTVLSIPTRFAIAQSTGLSDSLKTSISSSLNGGAYADVIESLKPYALEQDTSGFVSTTYLSAFLHAGEFEQGIAKAEQLILANASDPFSHYMYGRLLRATGDYTKALLEFREAGRLRRNFWINAVEYADLLRATGNVNDVNQIASTIASAYKQGYFNTVETLTTAGRAAAMVEDFHSANKAFRTAYEIDPGSVDNLFHWATIFREKYNEADARRTFSEAIKINPFRSDLQTGLALAVQGFAAREEIASKAVAINQNDANAIAILASMKLLDGENDAATSLIERSRAINRSDIILMGHAAAIAIVMDDSLKAKALEREAFTVNRQPVDYFVAAAEDLSLRFRYEESLQQSLKAVDANPSSAKALASAGAGLLRIGRADDARRYLERAFEKDPFNLFVGNMLTLVDEYDSFSTLESEHFQLLIPDAEKDILGPLVIAEAERAYTSFFEYYGYDPAGKIIIEAYSDADDFAVRIAGIPHLGLLGVAFGDVVAINTPRAQAGREYNWVRTLWHEIAHTMAIGLSDHRVPRWFTEGLSVYEEKQEKEEWGREMDLQFFSALDRDRLHSLSEMGRGFTRPEFPGQVLLSYYHASKVIEYLVENYGKGSIRQILVQLSQGLSIEEALESTSGEELDTLNARMMSSLRITGNQFNRVLQGMPDLLGDGGAPSLADPSAGGNNQFLKELRSGYASLSEENQRQAVSHFRKAIDLYPDYVASGNAYFGLAQIYRETGDSTALMSTLNSYLSISDYGVMESRELASLYLAEGKTEDAILWFERSLHVDPYDVDARRSLAELYLSTGQNVRAIEERRAVVSLAPVDEARAFFELALALYENDDLITAKRAVLQSLEIAPGFREAQKLLLKCVEGTR